MRLKACTKVAFDAATARSQAIAKEAPAPAATPLTAATVGTRRSISLRTVGLNACSITGPGSARCTRSGPGSKSNSERSAPAQKPRPAPVRTAARTDLSSAMRSSTAQRSRCIWRVKLLRDWGRFNVTSATAPRTSHRTLASLMESPCTVNLASGLRALKNGFPWL